MLPGVQYLASPGGLGSSQSLTYILASLAFLKVCADTYSQQRPLPSCVQFLWSQAQSLVSAEGRCQFTQQPIQSNEWQAYINLRSKAVKQKMLLVIWAILKAAPSNMGKLGNGSVSVSFPLTEHRCTHNTSDTKCVGFSQ